MSTKPKSLVDIVTLKDVIDVGELKISRTSLGKRYGYKERYLVYLPLSRNYLWKALHESKARVRIFLEIPEDVTKTASENRTPRGS